MAIRQYLAIFECDHRDYDQLLVDLQHFLARWKRPEEIKPTEDEEDLSEKSDRIF